MLVTGGAGFIGSHVVDRLVQLQAMVTVLDSLTYAGSLSNLRHHLGRRGFTFIHGDLAQVAEILADEAVDHVIHLAAESDIDRSIVAADVFLRTNLLGTAAVLEACTRSSVALTVVSTDGVYGSGQAAGVFSELDPMQPSSPYAASKAGADLLSFAFRWTYGTDVRIARGTNAYGPRQHPEKGIPTFVLAALAGRPIPVYGDGHHRREWLYVTDWATACLAIADAGSPGEAYNIGGGTEVSNITLASRICELAGSLPSLVGSVPDRPGHDVRYGLAWERLRALGWSPNVSLEDGMIATVDWYRSNGDWVLERQADMPERAY